ncbi:hypothetical protein [Marinicellulosiphila megalodicopiae]|uniref:hypothetical protein n=1 Tax=Marinicellulosiphila megalodicopiae TaxID=2724896 RepID=UPI003BAE5BE7
MANFLFAYHGGKDPDGPEEFASMMQAWEQWLTQYDKNIVDAGNPVGPNITVLSDGSVTKDGGSNPISGYGIFKADSFDEATIIAKQCPVLLAGGSVEVGQIFDVSQLS